MEKDTHMEEKGRTDQSVMPIHVPSKRFKITSQSKQLTVEDKFQVMSGNVNWGRQIEKKHVIVDKKCFVNLRDVKDEYDDLKNPGTTCVTLQKEHLERHASSSCQATICEDEIKEEESDCPPQQISHMNKTHSYPFLKTKDSIQPLANARRFLVVQKKKDGSVEKLIFKQTPSVLDNPRQLPTTSSKSILFVRPKKSSPGIRSIDNNSIPAPITVIKDFSSLYANPYKPASKVLSNKPIKVVKVDKLAPSLPRTMQAIKHNKIYQTTVKEEDDQTKVQGKGDANISMAQGKDPASLKFAQHVADILKDVNSQPTTNPQPTPHILHRHVGPEATSPVGLTTRILTTPGSSNPESQASPSNPAALQSAAPTKANLGKRQWKKIDVNSPSQSSSVSSMPSRTNQQIQPVTMLQSKEGVLSIVNNDEWRSAVNTMEQKIYKQAGVSSSMTTSSVRSVAPKILEPTNVQSSSVRPVGVKFPKPTRPPSERWSSVTTVEPMSLSPISTIEPKLLESDSDVITVKPESPASETIETCSAPTSPVPQVFGLEANENLPDIEMHGTKVAVASSQMVEEDVKIFESVEDLHAHIDQIDRLGEVQNMTNSDVCKTNKPKVNHARVKKFRKVHSHEVEEREKSIFRHKKGKTLDKHVREVLARKLRLKKAEEMKKKMIEAFFTTEQAEENNFNFEDLDKTNIMHASSAIKYVSNAHYIGLKENPPRLNLKRQPLFIKDKTSASDITAIMTAMKKNRGDNVAKILMQLKVMRKPVMNHILEESCLFLEHEPQSNEVDWSLPWEKRYKELMYSLHWHLYDSEWCNKVFHATQYSPVLVLICLQILLNGKDIATASNLEQVLLKMSLMFHILSDGLFWDKEVKHTFTRERKGASVECTDQGIQCPDHLDAEKSKKKRASVRSKDQETQCDLGMSRNEVTGSVLQGEAFSPILQAEASSVPVQLEASSSSQHALVKEASSSPAFGGTASSLQVRQDVFHQPDQQQVLRSLLLSTGEARSSEKISLKPEVCVSDDVELIDTFNEDDVQENEPQGDGSSSSAILQGVLLDPDQESVSQNLLTDDILSIEDISCVPDVCISDLDEEDLEMVEIETVNESRAEEMSQSASGLSKESADIMHDRIGTEMLQSTNHQSKVIGDIVHESSSPNMLQSTSQALNKDLNVASPNLAFSPSLLSQIEAPKLKSIKLRPLLPKPVQMTVRMGSDLGPGSSDQHHTFAGNRNETKVQGQVQSGFQHDHVYTVSDEKKKKESFTPMDYETITAMMKCSIDKTQPKKYGKKSDRPTESISSEKRAHILTMERKMRNVLKWFSKTFSGKKEAQETFVRNVQKATEKGKDLKRSYIAVEVDGVDPETNMYRNASYISGPVDLEEKMMEDDLSEDDNDDNMPLYITCKQQFLDDAKCIIQKDFVAEQDRQNGNEGQSNCTVSTDVSMFKVNIADAQDPGSIVLTKKIMDNKKMEDIKYYSEKFGHDFTSFFSLTEGDDYREIEISCPFCAYQTIANDLSTVLYEFGYHFKVTHTNFKAPHTTLERADAQKIYHDTLHLFEEKEMWVDNPCSAAIPQVFVCFHCKFASAYRHEYYSHLLRHKDQSTFYVCYKCETSFDSHKELFEHYNAVHDINVDCPNPPSYNVVGSVDKSPKLDMPEDAHEPAYRTWRTSFQKTFLEEIIANHPKIEKFNATADFTDLATVNKFAQVKAAVKDVLMQQRYHEEMIQMEQEKKERKEKKEEEKRKKSEEDNVRKLKEKIAMKERQLEIRIRKRVELQQKKNAWLGCLKCKILFKTRKEKVQHDRQLHPLPLTTHEERMEKLRCKECNEPFKSTAERMMHDLAVHKKPNKRMYEEVNAYESKYANSINEKAKKKLREMGKLCVDCDITFKSKSEALAHEFEVHRRDNEEFCEAEKREAELKQKKKDFIEKFGHTACLATWKEHLPEFVRSCDVENCKYEAVSNVQVLQHKIRMHGEPYPFVCHMCGGKFVSEMKMKCHSCEKTSQHLESLKEKKEKKRKIMVNPHDQRPVVGVCPRCGKTYHYPNRRGYNMHVKNVNCTNDPDFKPEIQGPVCEKCGKEFSVTTGSGSFRRHIMIVNCTNDPNFVPKKRWRLEKKKMCERCGKMIRKNKNYRHHIDNVNCTKDPNFVPKSKTAHLRKCKRCGNMFSTNYRHHVRNVNCTNDPNFVPLKLSQSKGTQKVETVSRCEESQNKPNDGIEMLDDQLKSKEMDAAVDSFLDSSFEIVDHSTENHFEHDQDHQEDIQQSLNDERIVSINPVRKSNIDVSEDIGSNMDSRYNVNNADKASTASSYTNSALDAVQSKENAAQHGNQGGIPLQEIASEVEHLPQIEIPDGCGLVENEDGQYYIVPLDQIQQNDVMQQDDIMQSMLKSL